MSTEKLTILISPTHRCNMRCEYCYVSSSQHDDMSLSDIKAAYEWILEYCRYLDVKIVDFTWFGGEPLLYGEEKLEYALKEQPHYFDKAGIKYVNRMQSNLSLISARTCRIIKDYFGGFIGGSFEPFGTDRKYKNGKTTIADVEQNIEFLHNMGLRIGVVCTLTKKNLRSPIELYNWFKQRVDAFRVNRAHYPDGLYKEKYLSLEEYNKYIIDLFNIYTKDETIETQFSNFVTIVHSILLKRPLSCTDIIEPHWKLSIAGNGEISSYCRKRNVILGNYYSSPPEAIIKKYKRESCPELIPNSCCKCDSFINNICSGPCLGEPNMDCHESDCGYRNEYTKETISYVQQYLQAKGIKKIEDL